MPRKQLNVDKWQDYRGKTEGIMIYMETSPTTDLPVRDVLNENGKGFQSEPNYETNSYAFFSCCNSKLNSSIHKSKRRYFFFATQYNGALEPFKGKFLIVGYMRVDKILEVRKRHIRQWMENKEENQSPECVDLKSCYGYYSREMHFYAPEDAFELNEEIMKGWGYKGRVAKHMKLSFSPEHSEELLAHFAAKSPKDDEYIATVDSLLEEKAKILAEAEAEEEEGEEDDEDW